LSARCQTALLYVPKSDSQWTVDLEARADRAMVYSQSFRFARHKEVRE